MLKAKQFFLPFLHKEQVAKDTYSFYFDRSKIDFDFLPGQYIRMALPHESPDDRGTTRFFTIASSPLEKDYLMFTVKIIESSFKKALFALQPSQSVQFFGPLGNFILDENDQTERVFLAGGIGMTPFYSMITYAAAKKLAIPITLLVSFAKSEEMIFYYELTKITSSNIRIIYTLTAPEVVRQKWNGEVGRISQAMIAKYVSDIALPIYSIVGSLGMVEETKQILHIMEIAEEKIISEDFSGY